jgi:meiotic recombination protein DMC1
METEEHQVEEVGETLEADFIPIEKLQDSGINVADLKKLKEAGCNTVQSLQMRTKKVFML